MKNIIIVIFMSITAIGFTQEKYKIADIFFEKMQYNEAIKQYEIAIANGDISKEILQKIGDAYYFNTNMEDANKWYGKLITEYKGEIGQEYIFRYAQSFQGIGKYKAARKWMKEFSERANINSEKPVQNEIALKNILEKEQQFVLNNLSINTVFSDFGPMYYGDKLIYASAKDSSYYQTNKYNVNKPLFLNLYIGSINSKNADVTLIKEFSRALNSKYHEATLSFTSDFKKVYYTRNNYNGNKGIDKVGINRLKLYSAAVIEDENGKVDWGNIKELPFNSEEYSVGHPALSKDGTKLYFVSDMPGSIGATDIFVVDILGEDEYSRPRNLGTSINTSGREMFPFVTEKKLYFASDGHLGLGGLDIFESNYNTIFETPVNLGAPLNSVLDDFGYIVNEEKNNGFVCSNRNSGKGDDDIYYFDRISTKSCKQAINGYISNNLTGERISNVTVILCATNGDELEETETKINGEYIFSYELNCNMEYLIKVQKIGYKSTEKPILTNDKRGETVVPIGLDFTNELIVEENGLLKIKIGIIYFDLNKSNIRKDAAIQLDKVVLLMNQYPMMVLNIESHTDSRGLDDYNLALSDRRAKATRDYIISKGINTERIIKATGYGETQLLNECKNGVPCSDILNQLNRRSEFIILKI
ncbi:OmpA family protein [uncultured Lutibacter sp.]|uniref:OmpA family protein n=1 Tax=uncultured Lutibacter sp. TaxID=437739 RepID=UPI0026166635|nr:OmpA family protein [uncultured Lutibacter sp.]